MINIILGLDSFRNNMNNFQELNNMELIRTVNDEAYKRNLNAEDVFSILEEAIRLASKQRYGNSKLKVVISRNNGAISVFKQIKVVDDVVDSTYVYDETISDTSEVSEDVYEVIKISDAVNRYPTKETKVGDIISERLPYVEFGRLAVRSARYTIMTLIKECEQKKQYEKYKDRIGDIVVGAARKVSKGGIVVELGDAEAYLPVKNMIRGEIFKQSESIKAIILSVKYNGDNCQITLSRADSEFMAALFAQEVPEIYDGIITIHAIARDPGSKAKIAVHSSDKNIDPIGACVGIRSSRIQAVIKEINGEKIDIIVYSSDLAEFVVNAISPARVIRPIMNEERKCIELIVEQDQLSLAIGKGGQNVRLASELVGWKIDILNEHDASSKRLQEFSSNTEILVKDLNVEEIIAQLLITEGLSSAEEIANTDIAVLAAIEGFDVDIASEILKRAQEYLKSKVDERSDLYNLPTLTAQNIEVLQKYKIESLQDLAELSTLDFKEMVPTSDFTDEVIDELIMSARKQLGWFE